MRLLEDSLSFVPLWFHPLGNKGSVGAAGIGSFEVFQTAGVAVEPVPPVFRFMLRFESGNDAVVLVEPAFPVVGRITLGLVDSNGYRLGDIRLAAFICGTNGPALGNTKVTFTVIAAIRVNP